MQIGIGEFSRMTHLSIKALRHYHELGVLVPARIDPSSGYRYYDAEQLRAAQVIRRFRDLGMPLDDIGAVLAATEPAERNALIVAHLDRMQAQLAELQQTVGSLRSLLDGPTPPIPIEHRSLPAVPALAIAEPVTMAELEAWWAGAFDELRAVVAAAGVEPGTGGGLYPGELFEVELADVVAFLPVPAPIPTAGRTRMIEVPAAELAVAVHSGPFADLDRTYGAVGLHVAESELAVDGPIREYYLEIDAPDERDHRIEVAWPILAIR